MNTLTVAGIDPGLSKTGFSVVQFQATRVPQIIHHEVIKTSAEKGLKGRAKLLSDRERTVNVSVEIVDRLVKFDPNFVSMEDFVFMGNRGRSESQTVRVVENILVECRSAGYDTSVYDNAYWKHVLMKCRTATKEQVRHYVCRALQIPEEIWVKTDRGGHMLDAVALALTHVKLLKLKGVPVPWSTI